MPEKRDLRAIIERNAKAIELLPSTGQGTATTRVRVRSGLTCEISDGAWTLTADASPGEGGANLGPDPGVLVRAGLGSCLAQGYVMWAAKLGVPIEGVEVVVDADYDARGMFGVDDAVVPGWPAVRYTAYIESGAPAERVREMVEMADRHSPVLDDLRRAGNVSGELRIGVPAGE
jgi:uncharacterized OsmC-like protein